MEAVVSLLPALYYSRVETIWNELERQQGLTGVKITPFPHFSWQGASVYPPEELEKALRELAAELPPLPIRTTGLGLFTGEKAVIYIAVTKSPQLFAFHERLWERLEPLAEGMSPLYAPSLWMPHITLAFQDVGRSNLGRVLEQLAFQNYTWEMIIDNIAFISQPSSGPGTVQHRFRLEGQGSH